MTKPLNPHDPRFYAILQSDFPVTERPFQVLANRLDTSEQNVINAIEVLFSEGTIRAFGPVFDSKKMGYVSTLAAVEIDNENISTLAKVLHGIPEVTHAYIRAHTLNLWFTVTAQTPEKLNSILSQVEQYSYKETFYDFPAEKVFKINAVFGASTGEVSRSQLSTLTNPITGHEEKIIKALQNSFLITRQPYKAIADSLGISQLYVIDTLREWIQQGIIRRFGARLDHHNIGYHVNVLAVWSGEEIDMWGEKFASFKEVSHCYRRKPYPGWPYKLYTMIHAKDEIEMKGIIARMRTVAEGADMIPLRTLREIKKTTMKYFMEE